jgi:hypothetical protein
VDARVFSSKTSVEIAPPVERAKREPKRQQRERRASEMTIRLAGEHRFLVTRHAMRARSGMRPYPNLDNTSASGTRVSCNLHRIEKAGDGQVPLAPDHRV